MEYKQLIIGEILESEKEMVLKGGERYGKYFVNAANFNVLLHEFIKSVNADRFIFAAFLSQVRKHHTLALFSVMRLHHTQSMMDLRQVLEAGACAAYAIANTEIEDFANVDDQGILNLSDALTKRRYTWLEKNYAAPSNAIKKIKGLINSSVAHSNIVFAHTNFKYNQTSTRFDTPFFDIENEYLVKSDLGMTGKAALVLMDLFYDVNKERNVIILTDDFISRLKLLEEENENLMQEIMASPHFKRTKN